MSFSSYEKYQIDKNQQKQSWKKVKIDILSEYIMKIEIDGASLAGLRPAVGCDMLIIMTSNKL